MTVPIFNPKGSKILSAIALKFSGTVAQAAINASLRLNGALSDSTSEVAPSWLYKASSVPTTASLASTPVKIPTVAGQLSFSIPIGLNTGVKPRPISLSTDLLLFS